MKKLPFLVAAVGVLAVAVFGNAVPALCAAPEKKAVAEKKTDVPRENWKTLFADGLFTADGEAFPLAKFGKKKFVGIYCSASWCGPCVHFTPRLIQFYKEHEADMDVVLVGCDRTPEQVFAYAKKHEMPWLVMNKASSQQNAYMARNGIRGIPNFRLYDAATGKLLVADGVDLLKVERVVKGLPDTASAGTPELWNSFFAAGLFNAKGEKVDLQALTKSKKHIGIFVAADRDPKDAAACKRTAAELAQFYRKNKKRLEIVFVTFGKDRDALLKMMKDMKMPWLAAEPSNPEAQRYILKYDIKGVPDFRIFSPDGKEISDKNLDAASAARALNGR